MENESKFNLKPLTTKDLFPLSTILSKIGVKQLTQELKDNGYLEQLNNEEVDKTSLYISIALTVGGLVLENLEKCETHLYKFLSNVSGIDQNEIGNLPPADFLDLIVEIVSKEEFKDFFKAASRFVK